jgi:hypothetical protein
MDKKKLTRTRYKPLKPFVWTGKQGRPVQYTDEILDKLSKSLTKWVDKCREEEELHLLSEWCLDNNFSVCNFKRYTDKHEKFKEAHEYAKDYQAHQVSKGALTKKYDSGFSQFFLGCAHQWKTKDEAEDRKVDLKNDFVKFMEKVKEDDQ